MDLPLAAGPLGSGLLADPLGQLLVGLVALAAIVLVGRVLLSVAWKLLLVAIVVVGGLYTAGVLL
ncbi:hypothetical protein M0R88_02295 [Halorussus gelatinilyticus]|uniref:Uncharacterized protein n=1 Tax=Halorussus gelatinilyticus TaxID=2937524 RepID=A0A8U0IIT9_9EURY|nr:hypothetical protein [Halorussus gelatinilyticus]UPW00943.1 hypothetical protein M0R88_02295 [Halorussus gelatinilyticus]